MTYIYIDEKGKKHNVVIHNFSRQNKNLVRIMSDITLNPTDTTGMKDKKWVEVSELLVPATFSKEFIEKHLL